MYTVYNEHRNFEVEHGRNMWLEDRGLGKITLLDMENDRWTICTMPLWGGRTVPYRNPEDFKISRRPPPPKSILTKRYRPTMESSVMDRMATSNNVKDYW